MFFDWCCDVFLVIIIALTEPIDNFYVFNMWVWQYVGEVCNIKNCCLRFMSPQKYEFKSYVKKQFM